MRGVVDTFVRWYLDGTFGPRTDETDWCRHIFRESNKAADTRAKWLMDNDDSGPGAHWEAPDLHEKFHETRPVVFRWGQKGADWVQLPGFCGCGTNLDPLRKSLAVDVC